MQGNNRGLLFQENATLTEVFEDIFHEFGGNIFYSKTYSNINI